jgi:hypothetical protein
MQTFVNRSQATGVDQIIERYKGVKSTAIHFKLATTKSIAGS